MKPIFTGSLAGAHTLTRRSLMGLSLCLLCACALPDKPQMATLYDLGPPPEVKPGQMARWAGVVLDEVDVTPELDGTGLLYRLAYVDAQQLHPYANARWSMPPAQLLQQRLRQRLSPWTAVLNRNQAAGLHNQSAAAVELSVQLEEFSQFYSSPQSSQGWVSFRATLTRGTQLLGQRNFTVRRDAKAADAAAGARALAESSDEAIHQLSDWLRQIDGQT